MSVIRACPRNWSNTSVLDKFSIFLETEASGETKFYSLVVDSLVSRVSLPTTLPFPGDPVQVGRSEKTSVFVWRGHNFFPSSRLFLPPRTMAVPTNCKSCASRRTKRHERKQTAYVFYVYSIAWSFESFMTLRRTFHPPWPLDETARRALSSLFLRLRSNFPRETWSCLVSCGAHPFRAPRLSRWILIIVARARSSSIIWTSRGLFQSAKVS